MVRTEGHRVHRRSAGKKPLEAARLPTHPTLDLQELIANTNFARFGNMQGAVNRSAIAITEYIKAKVQPDEFTSHDERKAWRRKQEEGTRDKLRRNSMAVVLLNVAMIDRAVGLPVEITESARHLREKIVLKTQVADKSGFVLVENLEGLSLDDKDMYYQLQRRGEVRIRNLDPYDQLPIQEKLHIVAEIDELGRQVIYSVLADTKN
jgi:hypothetical protein